MPRTHLVNLSVGKATKDALAKGYSLSAFKADVIAGLTVAIIAIPLSMALAIAIGLPPQYGLYTAIVAGIIVPLLGGSRFSVTGPTAAFIVLLAPVVETYGYSGLLITTIMAGVMLCLLALVRLGRYIEYIPSAVTLGFTAGIAVVIACYQLEYLLGASLPHRPESVIDVFASLFEHYRSFHAPALLIGLVTLITYFSFAALRSKIPAYLPAILLAGLCAYLLESYSTGIDTIGSTFHFLKDDGTTGMGVPQTLPHFALPWSTVESQSDQWTFQDFVQLLPTAFALALLGAIESLLCAVVLDQMSNEKHSANTELFAQGLGNIITPFFGGFTATAAIARSATNLRAGAQTPVASALHGFFVLIGMLAVAPLIAYIPMSALAALLLVVAWNMSELKKCVQLVKRADTSDVCVFLICFLLTVFVDMVIAILAGILLASLLFVRTMAKMTTYKQLGYHGAGNIYQIEGPLFFAAADRVFDEITFHTIESKKQEVIISFKGVNIIDAGGISALKRFLDSMAKQHVKVMLCDFSGKAASTFTKSFDVQSPDPSFNFLRSLEDINTSEPRRRSST